MVTAVCPAPNPGFRRDIELHGDSLGRAEFGSGEVVFYQCASLHIPVSGNHISTCQKDGTWSEVSFKCRGKWKARVTNFVL